MPSRDRLNHLCCCNVGSAQQGVVAKAGLEAVLSSCAVHLPCFLHVQGVHGPDFDILHLALFPLSYYLAVTLTSVFV